MNMRNSILLFFIIIISSCQTLEFPSEDILKERELLREDCSYIGDSWNTASDNFNSYYGEIIERSTSSNYYPVWFNSLGQRMHALIFEPEGEVKDTVLVIHGYAGNLLGYKYIIPFLLRKKYRVAALMLPGHSINDNPRGDIDDFNLYGQFVKDFLDALNLKGIKVNYAIGHSTGATSLLIYNQLFTWDFKRVVFIAPLIRSAHWYLSCIGRFFSKNLVCSSNIKWRGPLAMQVFPMHWFDELIKWNKNNKDYTVSNTDLLLIQGRKDNVVDWRYNVPFLENLFPNITTIFYPEAGHTVFMKDNSDGLNSVLNIVWYIDGVP